MSGLKIGQNISSLGVQRQLTRVSDGVSRSFERLSSGLRINRASDDPAGLAVSTALNAQSRVYSQSIRNANDGLSLLTIADSALNELSEVVTRQKELAEQAANGVYTNRQRESLDTEATALSAEYDRILASTQFNGVSLFSASGSSVRIQTGIGLAESTQINLPSNLVEQLAGDGTFTFSASYSLHSGVGGVQAADLNGDGNIDLIGHGNNFGNPFIKSYLGDGTGSFTSVSSFNFPGDGLGAITIADFNEDGKLDVVDISDNTNRIVFFAGNGDGSFGTAVTFASGNGPRSIAGGDFNADGHEDIVVASYYDASVNVYFGNGNGTFGSPTTLLGTNGPFSVKTADLNGDGVIDIMASEFGGSNRNQVYYGNGNGTFQAPVVTPSVSGIGYSSFGDFNGDGRIDILSTITGGINIYEQAANGTFSTVVSSATPGESSYVHVADVNEDGKADLLSGGPGTNVSVRFGNGDFTFAAAVTSNIGVANPYILTSDLNNDGALDGFFISADSIQVLIGGSSVTGGPPPPLDLTTQAGAREALELTTGRLESLASQRSSIGSSMSRLSVVISNLHSRVENYEAANSRIISVDFAEETANLARMNILQQTGTAVLAQANLQPQLVLALLKP